MTTAIAGVAARTAAVGLELVHVPSGLAVIGAAKAPIEIPPRWVEIPTFRIGMTAVSESEFRQVMGRPGRGEAPADRPVTLVSWNEAIEFLRRYNVRGGVHAPLALPSNEQWERAARGPAVDIAQAMEAERGRYLPAEFAEFTKDRFEHFFERPGGAIYADARDEVLQRLLRGGARLFGWRVYSTPSGRLSDQEVWYQHSAPEAANWGPAGPFGTHCMTGGVWEWTDDFPFVRGARDQRRSLRGGSWNNQYPGFLRIGHHDSAEPDSSNELHGFRVVAAAAS